MRPLSDLHLWFPDLFERLAYFVPQLQALGTVPGHGGSITLLLPVSVQAELEGAFDQRRAPEVKFSELSKLSDLQNSPLPGSFDAESVSDDVMIAAGAGLLNGRALLSTVAGGSVANLSLNWDKRLCVIVILNGGTSFRLAYGNVENGSVPSRDIACHIAAHAANFYCAPGDESVVLHLHPQALIEFTRFPDIVDTSTLNSALCAQRLEFNEVIPEGIAFLPFLNPSSERAVSQISPLLRRYRTVALKHHGLTLRGRDLEECVSRVAYVETAARAAVIERLVDDKSYHLSEICYDKRPSDLEDMPHISRSTRATILKQIDTAPGTLRPREESSEVTKKEDKATSIKQAAIWNIVLSSAVGISILAIIAVGVVAMTTPSLSVAKAIAFFAMQFVLTATGTKLWFIAVRKRNKGVDLEGHQGL